MSSSNRQLEEALVDLKFDDQPDSAHRDRLEAQLHMAWARRVWDQASSPVSAWRAFIGSRITHYSAAAAAAVLLAVAAWFWLAGGGSAQPPVALAAGWRIEPTGPAAYSIVRPDRIRLDRGELLVESAELADPNAARPPLTIETSTATATAAGTRFYIATHQTSKGQSMKMTRLTRVLVLSGMVALASRQGSITGGANELLAAEPGQAPVKVAVQANSDFALDLYARFAKENAGKNMFFSPYSISSALAMTAEGARGETAAEMGKVLRFPEAARRIGDDAQLIPWQMALIHTGMAELSGRRAGGEDKAVRAEIDRLRKALDAANAKAEQLRKQESWSEQAEAARVAQRIADELNAALTKVDQYELRIANALWGEKTYPFRDSYVQTIDKYYKTGCVRQADFRNNFPAERTRINDWISEQTSGRIKDLVPNLPVDQAKLVRLILANAVYFKGEWSVPFKEAGTKSEPFTFADGKSVKTPIMHAWNLDVARYAAFNADGSFFDTPAMIQLGRRDEKGLYPGAGGFAMLEMPYKGEDLSMVVVAPNDPDGLAAIEKKLIAENLAAWIGRLQKRKVNVFMPKFKLQTEYDMGKTLQALGMVRAFVPPGPGGADFSGMSASNDPMDQLYISMVLHKAFVEVNERGTEAAAATAVMMLAEVGVPPGQPTVPFVPTFRADRPFLLLIRDVHTGSILFMGRLADPRQ